VCVRNSCSILVAELAKRIVLNRPARSHASRANLGATPQETGLWDGVRRLEPDGALFVTRDNCQPAEVAALARSLKKQLSGAGVIALADREKCGVWLYRPADGASGLALRVVGPEREQEIRARPIDA
jgi:hypothetical protein